ncbi:hypothetical protein [Methylobacterium sp. A54F]
MKSLNRVGAQPASLPLSADDIVEFHAARLMLLLHLCGVKGRIDGLTKMAKLDFFARYPEFFEAARSAVEARGTTSDLDDATDERVESAMVRHHYGPWDKRYYHVLAHLEAKKLINVAKSGKSYQISLTSLGIERTKLLVERSSFKPIVERMREIKRTFGAKNGSYLKNLIYKLFDTEVGKRPMGERISR